MLAEIRRHIADMEAPGAALAMGLRRREKITEFPMRLGDREGIGVLRIMEHEKIIAEGIIRSRIKLNRAAGGAGGGARLAGRQNAIGQIEIGRAEIRLQGDGGGEITSRAAIAGCGKARID